MSKKKCLFVVEGEKTEKEEITSFCKNILSLVDGSFDISVVGTSIHDLIRQYDPNEYTSIVSYLVDKKKFRLEVNTKTSEAYSLIYLVFDFDPQAPLFNKETLRKFAHIFIDETSVGKLYINYPMFEAAIDISSFDDGSYLEHSVSIIGLNGDSYKKKAKANSCLKHKRNSDLVIYPIPQYFYKKIIEITEIKYRLICGMTEDSPWKGTNTPQLLDAEIRSLEEDRCIPVISSFVLLARDY
jgi:hypothetical protein